MFIANILLAENVSRDSKQYVIHVCAQACNINNNLCCNLKHVQK